MQGVNTTEVRLDEIAKTVRAQISKLTNERKTGTYTITVEAHLSEGGIVCAYMVSNNREKIGK